MKIFNFRMLAHSLKYPEKCEYHGHVFECPSVETAKKVASQLNGQYGPPDLNDYDLFAESNSHDTNMLESEWMEEMYDTF